MKMCEGICYFQGCFAIAEKKNTPQKLDNVTYTQLLPKVAVLNWEIEHSHIINVRILAMYTF